MVIDIPNIGSLDPGTYKLRVFLFSYINGSIDLREDSLARHAKLQDCPEKWW